MPDQTARTKARNAIFASKPQVEIVTWNGQDIELRQPSLGAVLDRNSEDVDRKVMIAQMLVELAFVPGTNEHVFEEGDIPILIDLPFNADFQAVNAAITRLSNAEVTVDSKKFPETEQPPVGGAVGGEGAGDQSPGSQDVDGE